ncbi:MAG: hypothetical protein ACYC6T_05075 [Thermoleophilia bacterium]
MTAPDQLEPYTARLRFRGRFDDPPRLIAGFLEDVARSCDRAGASVIGHLKAHARTARGVFHCNLATPRSGAHCAGPLADHPVATDSLDLDLAVLVYGLPSHAVADLVTEAAERLRKTGLTDWVTLSGDETAEAATAHAHPTAHEHHHDHRHDH